MVAGFPRDFLWGAATSAHQLDGGDDQWTRWELANADRLAAAAARDPRLPAVAGARANYVAGRGVEHRRHAAADIALLRELGLRALRFGVDWARLQPRPGTWDTAEAARLRDYLTLLDDHGVTPLPTLWHWAVPPWFADRGGFERTANVAAFGEYAARVAEVLAGRVPYVFVLNEPNVYTSMSYLKGHWPPQRRDPVLAARVYRTLVRAQREAHDVLRAADPTVRVGVATSLAANRAVRAGARNRAAVAAVDLAWNWWFLDRVRGSLDLVGVNFYRTYHYDALLRRRDVGAPRSDLGWPLEPDGLRDVLASTWQRYRLPMIVTENGLADAADRHRQWWLERTLAAMAAALADGVDLRGYLHWSLFDNFEWSSGWWPRFGLVHVDRDTLARTPRPSARWLAERLREP